MSDELSLDLLGLRLTKSTADATHGFVFNVIAEGATFGVAQSAQEIVTSLLADGDLVRITRFGNREVSFLVEISGPSLAALAQGEAKLRSVVGRGGDLVWQPPDSLAFPTAFDVITSSMDFRFDDLGGELRNRRVFMVTLVCLPAGRSLSPVTVPALANGTTSVSVDTCDTTTGWTATYSGGSATPSNSWEAGSVGVAELNSTVSSPETWTLTRTGSVNFSTTPFLVAQIRTLSSGVGQPMDVTAYAGSSTSAPLLPVLSIRKLNGSTYFEVVYDASNVAGGTVSALTFKHTSNAGEVWQGLFIASLVRTNASPSITARQLTRIISVGGTERTPGSIHVQTSAGTGSLTQAIVHTCPEDGSGYSPPLRRWRTTASTGTVVTTAANYSGAYESVRTAVGGFYAEVPTSALPEGGYTLVARMAVANIAGGSVPIFYSTSTIFPSGTAQEGYTNGSKTFQFPNDSYHLVELGPLSLPSVRTSAGKVQIVIQVPSFANDVVLDEAWLFRDDEDCALTIVDTTRPHLWLSSPDAMDPVPRVWVGDGSDTRVHPGTGLRAMGAHILSPEGTAVFTAALTNGPATDATFYRRWHTNAAS